MVEAPLLPAFEARQVASAQHLLAVGVLSFVMFLDLRDMATGCLRLC